MREEVLETFLRVSREAPANPSSIHRAGRHAQAVLENAREEVAELLHASARDIIFTSGATEASNLGILGLARAMRRVTGEPLHLIASRAEHPSALAPLRLLQQEGFPLHLVALDANAKADIASILAHQAQHPVSLVVLQWANNETGVVQDVASLATTIDHDHLWHCDAVQGFGKLALDPTLWQASSLALSGHKFGAPKGVGALRLQESAMIDPIQIGGGQQRALRSGTESPALAASFAHALRIALEQQESFQRRAGQWCEIFLGELQRRKIPFEQNHSQQETRLPNTLNLSFPSLDGRMLVPACDTDGLETSAGAACSSGAAMPSSVLIAAGLSPEVARASIRISFGPDLGEKQVLEAAKRLGMLLQRLYEVAKR